MNNVHRARSDKGQRATVELCTFIIFARYVWQSRLSLETSRKMLREESQVAQVVSNNKQLQHMHKQLTISQRIREARKARHNPHQKSERPLTEIRRKKITEEINRQEKKLKRIHTIGVETYNALVRCNPKVSTNKAYRFALHYLLIERDFVNNQGFVLLPDYKIAVWCGTQAIEQYISGNFNCGVFLKALKADVLPDLVMSDYYGPSKEDKGQCRCVINDGLQGLVEYALDDFDEKERYDLLSMMRWNRTNAKANRDRLIAEVLAQEWSYEQQAKVAHYLHTLPFGLFTKQIPYRIQEASDYIKPAPGIDSKERRRQYCILHRIEDCPQPIYRPGQSKRNARLFAFDSLCDVERHVRRILCQGWHEVDLVSCYPAISARIWNIEQVQSMIECGVDVWNAIAGELGIVESERENKRDVIKEGGCRLLCGGKIDKTNELLKKHGIEGVVADSPTLMAMVRAVQKVKQRVRVEGGTQTPMGWIACPNRKDKSVRSHLSNVLAAYELALIAPCFEVAERSHDFTITICQHDGFSIKLRQEDRLQQVLTRLNKAIKPVAEQYGIVTHLEYKT